MTVRLVQLGGWLFVVGAGFSLSDFFNLSALAVRSLYFGVYALYLTALPFGVVGDIAYSRWARFVVARANPDRHFPVCTEYSALPHVVVLLCLPIAWLVLFLALWLIGFSGTSAASVVSPFGYVGAALALQGIIPSRRHGSLFLGKATLEVTWDDGRSFAIPYRALADADQLLKDELFAPERFGRAPWREMRLSAQDTQDLRALLDSRIGAADRPVLVPRPDREGSPYRDGGVE